MEKIIKRLGWCHTSGQNFPTVRAMAFDILAIPLSTPTANSVFCTETMKINPISNGLDPNIMEALVCGKDWLNNRMWM